MRLALEISPKLPSFTMFNQFLTKTFRWYKVTDTNVMSTTTQILNLQSRLEQLGINSQISGSPSSGMYIKTLSIDFDDNSYVMVTYGFDGIEQFQLLYGTKNLDTQVFSFSTIEQTINFIQNLKK